VSSINTDIPTNNYDLNTIGQKKKKVMEPIPDNSPKESKLSLAEILQPKCDLKEEL
jgi:hypothetical protein